MNILYVGNVQGFDNASKFYMIPQKLVNGFTRNGHNVYMFNDRDYSRASNMFHSSKFGIKATNKKLLEDCRSFQPDLIVLGHCKHISNETLNAIRESLPSVKIIYRNVDPLHSEKNVQDINDRVDVVDGIFVTTAGAALKQFESAKTFVSFMPNPVDSSIETGRAFESPGEYDLFFAGSFLRDQYDQRHQMLRRLQDELTDLRIGFFGSNLGSEKVFGRDYMTKLENSCMGLCLNKTSDYYLYASDRMAQYLGQGVLVFIDEKSGFQDLFDNDEMAFYKDTDDIIAKVQYYNKHDDERRATAAKGWEKAHCIFDCCSVASYLVEKTFGLPYSKDYCWL